MGDCVGWTDGWMDEWIAYSFKCRYESLKAYFSAGRTF